MKSLFTLLTAPTFLVHAAEAVFSLDESVSPAKVRSLLSRKTGVTRTAQRRYLSWNPDPLQSHIMHIITLRLVSLSLQYWPMTSTLITPSITTFLRSTPMAEICFDSCISLGFPLNKWFRICSHRQASWQNRRSRLRIVIVPSSMLFNFFICLYDGKTSQHM